MALVSPTRPLFASLPEFPTLGESITFQFTGLLVVFTALSSIWASVELMGWMFRLAARAKARRVAAQAVLLPATDAESSAAAASDQPPPEIVALIAAAVYAATDGKSHRIASITPLDPNTDWAREGRRNIFASHKTR